MKKIYTIMLILIGVSYSYAQSEIEGYEYWFNNDFANKTTTAVTPTQQLNVNQNIPTSGLSNGINSFNFRSFDNTGKYSTVISSFFYKTSALESNSNPEIVAYEYWIDNDYASAVVVNTPAQQQVNINELISMSSLSSGIHNFNIRFKDNANLWSSVASHFFYKTSALENNPNPEIVAYEYWIDNDYASAVVVNTPAQQQVNINELISMSSLSSGIHNFNIRFKDNANLWSSVASHFFYKTPQQIITQNLITEYRYWFDNDFANVVNTNLTPNQQINLIDNLDLTQVPKGIHEINFQFKDTLGMWSSVMVDTINKLPLPIADFTYSPVQECDSTSIAFSDNSFDGDIYFWDFGDGNTDTLANPTHVYYTPNTYQVSLTVTDTATGIDSTLIIPVTINSLNSSSAISETICDNYTAPDGQVHTSSGFKTAIIQNVAGCDSTITIDLNILNSTSSNINEASCDSYTAPDGQIYTTSGIKTAVIPNAVNCDSTITINLTINTVNTAVTQNGITLTADETGAAYQWLDCNNGYLVINGETSQSFSATQNGSYAVELTQNNCVDTSACFEVTTVGIVENTFGNDIIVYPNPTSGEITVNLGRNLAEFTVILNDMKGRKLSHSTYRNTDVFNMNLDGPSGIYLLTIKAGENKAIIRLIKN